MEEMTKYLKALVFLQLDARSNGGAFQKPEQLLSRAGFRYREIGDILGKSENAVKMALRRAKVTVSGEQEASDG